jgi:FAD/FMN-containing dehydrogenase
MEDVMTIVDAQPAAPFEDLAEALTGAVITPDDPDWDTARLAWNLAADQHPNAVAVPRNADDIIAVVRFANEHGLRVAAQGTGHQALALGDLAGSILVHTSAFTELHVDAGSRRVRAGAGVIWNTVSAALHEHGLAGLAGSAGDVGVVGYLLGGGYSWLGRQHGLAASSVTAIELVTGDAEFRRVDADNDAELFWALRGGGGNFGVVTAIEFEAVAVSDVYAGMLLFPLEKAAELLELFDRETAGMDERATLCARLLHLPPMPDLPDALRGKAFAGLDGAINASDAEAAALLEPFVALGPVMNTFARMPATSLVQIHMDPPMPVPGVGDGVILDELPPGAIEAILDAAGDGVQTPLLLVDVRMLGGALSRRDPRGGAVDSLPGHCLVYTIGIAPSPEAAQAVEAAAGSLIASLEPWRAQRDYANFAETDRRAEALYPDDALERLRAVKRRVDPADIIRGCHPLG